jgi:hypothetical protein
VAVACCKTPMEFSVYEGDGRAAASCRNSYEGCGNIWGMLEGRVPVLRVCVLCGVTRGLVEFLWDYSAGLRQLRADGGLRRAGE